MPRSPASCPVCGAAVPAGAKSCRECGADERTGWDEEQTRYDGLDLPDDAFDDDTPRRQSPKRRHGPNGLSLFWWIVGVLLLVVIATTFIGL
jgi:predicted nucleic acid-binding Zn ribbon protein